MMFSAGVLVCLVSEGGELFDLVVVYIRAAILVVGVLVYRFFFFICDFFKVFYFKGFVF